MSKVMDSAAEDDNEEEMWEVENDLRILAQSIEINKDPKRLAAVKALAKQKSAEMASIAKQ